MQANLANRDRRTSVCREIGEETRFRFQLRNSHRNRSLMNPRMLLQIEFYFAKLDTETSNFHLAIGPAVELDFPIAENETAGDPLGIAGRLVSYATRNYLFGCSSNSASITSFCSCVV